MALSSTEFYCSWPTVEQKVPLVHVPIVHAQKRFGGYGNLRGWLLAALKAAYPQVLDTPALLDAADAAFGPLQIAGLDQAADHGEDAGGGGQPNDVAELDHGREGVVPLPVGPQAGQVALILHFGSPNSHSMRILYE